MNLGNISHYSPWFLDLAILEIEISGIFIILTKFCKLCIYRLVIEKWSPDLGNFEK